MVTTTTGLATSFINFTRASNATVTNNVGNIAWAGHNLLTNSESFDASIWTKYNGGPGAPTLTATNAAVSPNGTTTAEDFLFPAIVSSAQESDVIQQITVPAGSFTGGVWVKAKSAGDVGKRFTVAAYSFASATLFALAHHTLTADWVLVTASGSCIAGAIQFYFGTVGSTYAGGGNQGSFSCYVWGAQFYRSDLGGMVYNPAQPAGFGTYYPTTPPNLLGNTENFSAASAARSNVTVIDNEIVAPNGLQTADRINATTTSGTHLVQPLAVAVTTVSGTTYVASAYVKAAEYTSVGIRENSSTGAWATFSLVGAGSLIAQGSGGSGTIIAVGNGWYRISMSSAAGATFLPSYFILDNGYTSGSPSAYSYAGTGFSGLYLWGAQLSDSASIDAYVPVYGAAVTSAAYYAPRLDYDPVNLQPRGILIEEQRTNIVPTSSNFTVAGWVKGNTGTGIAPVVTANDAVAPDGTLTAQKVVFDRGAGNTLSDSSILEHNISGYANATAYTASVYIKAATAGDVGKQLAWRHVGGNSYGVITLTAAWQRVTRTETSSGTSSTFSFISRGTISADNVVGAHIWGVSLEVGASNTRTTFATSLIPTNGSTVTRSADVCSISTQAFPYSPSESAIVASFSLLASGNPSNTASVASLDNGSTSQFLIYKSLDDSAAQFYMGSNVVSIGTISANTVTKIAITGNGTSNAGVVNAGSATALTSAMPATATNFNLGSNYGFNRMSGHIRQITYIPRRISNTELQQRTT